MAGIAIGILWMRREVHASAWARLRSLPRDVPVLVVILTLCALIGAPIALPVAFPVGAIIGPPLALLIVLLASGRGQIAGLFSTRPLVWLGEISFGVYILHWPLWWWVSLIAERALHLSPSSPFLLVTYLAALVASAGASYHWLETPMRHAIRARWSHSKSIAQGTMDMTLPTSQEVAGPIYVPR